MVASNKDLKFKGNKLNISGNELKVGDKAPEFILSGNSLEDVKLSDYTGKVVILSVVPSLDTPTCSISTKKFNQEASTLNNVVILTVSVDLPFAQKRWCGAEGISNVITLSDYKTRNFSTDYGVFIADLAITCRATFVIDQNGILKFVDYVEELSDEPNYEQVLETAKKLV